MIAATTLDVLLIEDSPTDVLLTEEALSEASRFHLRSSERLAEALLLLSETHFDVVLLDLGLPDSQGIDTLRRLRDRNNKVAVVVLTGKDDEELALRALQEGAEDYLVKGQADAGQLRRSIRYAVKRSKIEEALRESEELFRGAFENTKVAMALCDMGARFLRVNEAFSQMFGYSSEEMLRLSLADITRPDHLAESSARREQLLAGEGQFFQMEKRYLHKAGHVVWGLTNISLVRGRSGEPRYFVRQVQDITDRKRAEAERDALLSRLQIQIQRMPLIYVLFDSEFRVTDWNPAAERTLGYAREEALGKQPNDLTPPSFHARLLEIMERIRAGDMAAHSVNENLTKDGSTITCEWFNTPLMTEDRGFDGLLCLGRDVSQQKVLQDERAKLAASVEASEEQLRLLLESTGEGIYGIDMQGRCTFINRAAAAMIGYNPAEVIGQDLHALIHHHRPDGSPYPLERCPIYRAMQTQSGVRVRDEVLWRRDGTSFAAEYSSFSIMKGGKSRGAVVTFQDITQVRQLEEQFRQAQKMEAIGQLAGGVAHDFNNLLTVINGYTELLIGRLKPGDATRHILEQVNKSGNRAAGLTRQLLAFSRKQMLIPAVLDLNNLITEMGKMLRRLIGEDIDLAVKLEPGLWRVKADPGQMEQVVMNLVVNARDAMRCGGKLTIETANVTLDEHYASTHHGVTPGAHVLVAISDSGCGMDQGTLTHIFEPFYTTKGPDKGTGLGLAMVHGVVKQSGGSIEVYSEVGIGTTFKVYLPRSEKVASFSRSSSGVLKPARGAETILLVEDDAGVRMLARMILDEHGYVVLEAANGAEAMAICERHQNKIHLLLTDVVMPNMSGPHLAEKLMRLWPGLKVLFLSGYTNEAVAHHGIINAETPFLQKPFTPIALAQKLREVLDSNQTCVSQPNDTANA